MEWTRNTHTQQKPWVPCLNGKRNYSITARPWVALHCATSDIMPGIFWAATLLSSHKVCTHRFYRQTSRLSVAMSLDQQWLIPEPMHIELHLMDCRGWWKSYKHFVNFLHLPIHIFCPRWDSLDLLRDTRYSDTSEQRQHWCKSTSVYGKLWLHKDTVPRCNEKVMKYEKE